MKTLLCTAMLIASVSIANSAFSQGRGASASPAAGSQHGPSAAPTSSVATTKGNSPNQTGSTSTNAGHGATNKIGTEISDHPALSSKLQSLLPPGTDLNDASSGFKNMGQFVAAVHVSKNLNIPFDQLKAKMVTDNESLGGAILALKPAVTKDVANEEVKKAESQAREDKKTS